MSDPLTATAPERTAELRTHGVAITIPPPFGAALQHARERFGDPLARAIPPHVTLLPPTGIDERTMPTFIEHLQQVATAHAPFQMVLASSGSFRPVSPVVFVQVALGIPSCEQLESAVRSGPVERSLDFRYHPHVTVAQHLDDDQLDIAFDGMSDFRAAFMVSGIDLYAQGQDEMWRPVQSFPLTGGSPPGAGPAHRSD